MHRALYRKWRPKTFNDVCGQDHITSILKYQCNTAKPSHAYLFCGSRGTGKTTCSKILAKAVNCLSPIDGNPCGVCSSCISIDNSTTLDVIEMDAASNNGIDNIRDIRDEVIYSPSDLKYKVYIIDEVHMLSLSAFNALLKTLEEPPSHVIFILATTEMHKLPATIVSRCQRFDFRKLNSSDIASRLSYIAENEGAEITKGAAQLIARLADGGMRDAISLFELCLGASSNIDEELARDILGVCGRDTFFDLVSAIIDKDYAVIFDSIKQVEKTSKDITVFWQDLISFYRDLFVSKTLKDPAEYLDLSENEVSRLKQLAQKISTPELIRQTKILEQALFVMIRQGSGKRNVAELTLVRLSDASIDVSSEALLSRIDSLESKIMSINGKISDIPLNVSQNTSKAEISLETEEPLSLSYKDEKPALKEKESDLDFEHFISQNTSQSREKLKYWDDVIDSVLKTMASLKGFVDNTDGYLKADGEYLIVTDNLTSQRMLSREKSRAAIADAITFYAGVRVSDAQLSFEVDPTIKKQSSPIDELM